MIPREEEKLDKALWTHFDPPAEINRLVNMARYDLYYGPMQEGEDVDGYTYPGFSKAIDQINTWLSKVMEDVWYDRQSGEVLTKKPEGYEDEETGEYVEPMWEDYYHLKARDVVRTMFGRELGSYLRW